MMCNLIPYVLGCEAVSVTNTWNSFRGKLPKAMSQRQATIILLFVKIASMSRCPVCAQRSYFDA